MFRRPIEEENEFEQNEKDAKLEKFVDNYRFQERRDELKDED